MRKIAMLAMQYERTIADMAQQQTVIGVWSAVFGCGCGNHYVTSVNYTGGNLDPCRKTGRLRR